MRKAAYSFVGGTVIALVVLVGLAAVTKREIVQSTGVIVTTGIAGIAPGVEACQRSLVTLDSVAAVQFAPGGPGPAPGIAVRVRTVPGRAVLSRGDVARGFNPAELVTAELHPPVPTGRRVQVCFGAVGQGQVTLFGDDGITSQCILAPTSLGCRYALLHPTSTTSAVYVNGRQVPGTLYLNLLRDRPRSLLSSAGAIFHRASTFRPGFVSTALWWVLLVVLVLGAPAALALGMSDRPESGRKSKA